MMSHVAPCLSPSRPQDSRASQALCHSFCCVVFWEIQCLQTGFAQLPAVIDEVHHCAPSVFTFRNLTTGLFWKSGRLQSESSGFNDCSEHVFLDCSRTKSLHRWIVTAFSMSFYRLLFLSYAAPQENASSKDVCPYGFTVSQALLVGDLESDDHNRIYLVFKRVLCRGDGVSGPSRL